MSNEDNRVYITVDRSGEVTVDAPTEDTRVTITRPTEVPSEHISDECWDSVINEAQAANETAKAIINDEPLPEKAPDRMAKHMLPGETYWAAALRWHDNAQDAWFIARHKEQEARKLFDICLDRIRHLLNKEAKEANEATVSASKED